MPHLNKCCLVCDEWPLDGVIHKKKNEPCLWSFRRKYCTMKDDAQTYDFIADKSCLLFSIILKVLRWWEVIRTQGKCTGIIWIPEYINIYLKYLSLIRMCNLFTNSLFRLADNLHIYCMATWRYETSLPLLKKYFKSERDGNCVVRY